MDGIFATIVDLAKLGALGVGVAIALLVAVLIFRLKTIEPGTAALIKDLMKWGFAVAVVFGLMGLVPLFLQKEGMVHARITISPDLATQGLSAPRIELPDGTVVQPGQRFALQSSLTPQVLYVIADKTLADVRQLRQATATLAASVKTISEQRDALATSIESTPAVEDSLIQSSAQTDLLSSEVTKSVNSGDYQRVNALTKRLQSVVVSANRPVATISATPR